MNDSRPARDTGRRYDLVVVGSGIAGLFAAVRASAAGLRVAVLTKATLQECSSRYAQGGVAAALDPSDSPALHAADTIAAGRGLCNPAAVGILVEEGPGRIRELVELGVNFDTQDGVLMLGKEAAHSRSRIVHAGGDGTGREIEERLALRATSAASLILEQHAVSSLLVSDGRCVGVEALSLDRRRVSRLEAGAVLLATGGLGRCFRHTTNPPPATGDGVWLAYEAGAEIANLEFVQFHPTALALPGAPGFLISEAVRGEGAMVVDDRGERFLFGADPAGEMAGRDVVARAISEHMISRGLENVWLDLSPMGPQRALTRFPGIAAFCARYGLDVTTQRVPVAPAAHYQMGGVATDLHGATSLPGLFAAGEVASTGVHGANRLASNSLLESLVFSARAVDAILGAGESARQQAPQPMPPRSPSPMARVDLDRIRLRLQAAMWAGAGIVRDGTGLEATLRLLGEAADQLPQGALDPFSVELRAMLGTSQLLVAAALCRRESRGSHYRSDFPEPDDSMAGAVVQRKGAAAALRPLGSPG